MTTSPRATPRVGSITGLALLFFVVAADVPHVAFAGEVTPAPGAPLAVAVVVAPQDRASEQEDASAAQQHTQAAEQLLRQGNPEGALFEVEKAIAQDETLAAAWYVGGLAYGQLGRNAEARDYFVRATELSPGWGAAHRFASQASFDAGDVEGSWEHAIKAHQAGVDMSDAFSGLRTNSPEPDDLEFQLDAMRVFVGGFDTSVFDRDGTNSGAKNVVNQASADLFGFRQEARLQLSRSRSFGLVQRQEAAQAYMLFEIEFLSDTLLGGPQRRLRGVLKLVDARSGEELYRRRIDFDDISSLSYLNREFSRIMGLMEEWAAQRRR